MCFIGQSGRHEAHTMSSEGPVRRRPNAKRPTPDSEGGVASSSERTSSAADEGSGSTATVTTTTTTAAADSADSESNANANANKVKSARDKNDGSGDGTNYVSGGIEANPYLFGLIVAAPLLSLLLAYVTSEEMSTHHGDMATRPVSGMLLGCLYPDDAMGCAAATLRAASSVLPTYEGSALVLCFMGTALILERTLPGRVERGPMTSTGHVPEYVDNGVLHCLTFTALFYVGSNLGPGPALYDFGVLYDAFPGSLAFLNLFGMAFCAFLTVKGLKFPSTADCGTSGSYVKDYLWGTELYPRVCGLDLKRFVNCRFSMTYWQLSGLSYAYRSYTLHDNSIDYGLALSAVSQYLYLVKFFVWEMGYMRSIDIISDRAGFEIQWGCLVWVPAVYTLHTRFLVQNPSGLSLPVASLWFGLSLLGVALNYAADRERDVFRSSGGKTLVWGKEPTYIVARYEVTNPVSGEKVTRTSLLLASGFWGMARHFQYLFELTAAWSWCLMANPLRNGPIPLFYAAFLTYLLIDRADRDSDKCRLKYGRYYDEYCKLVPYKILPGVY